MAAVRAPREDILRGPARRCGLASRNTFDLSKLDRTGNLPRSRLDGLLAACTGRGVQDISQLREPVETPTEDFATLGENKGVVLADGYTDDCVREPWNWDRGVLRVLSWSEANMRVGWIGYDS